MERYTYRFEEIALADVPRFGGKNASLGEMFSKLQSQGINIPDGFATTASAYWKFLDENGIRDSLGKILSQLDTKEFSNLSEIGEAARRLMLTATLPTEIADSILESYEALCLQVGNSLSLAVRSSATAEDLPTASFAGLHDTFLNIKGGEALLIATQNCFASLFTDRAIKYRTDRGFEHMEVALSVGIQQMIQADKACSGVAFTIDPETGFNSTLFLSGVWGLGENIVQGTVNPDEFILFKPHLTTNFSSIISKTLGSKEQMMVYAEKGSKTPTQNISTPIDKRNTYVLTDREIHQLGRWCSQIEQHYGRPMDIEWAKDGTNGQLYIVQARPETVHSSKEDPSILKTYHLQETGELITKGIALGNKIAVGKARVLSSPSQAHLLREGEVLVTQMTNPDWDPIMKRAAAIVTSKGGRTSHAAIVAREIGTVAVVGTGNADQVITDGEIITVSCAEGKVGKVYKGNLKWETSTIDTSQITLPNTEMKFILSDPDKAFEYAFLPNHGVGLLRMEFIINTAIQIHPMALAHFEQVKNTEDRRTIEKLTRHHSSKEDYFVTKLSEAVALIAAAFYPKEVIVRLSDFKTNEYANLIGGKGFEPVESNPMLGFRGASRYYSSQYLDGFRLECAAMKRVRDELGFNNIKLMIPFCRTIEEGRKVMEVMESHGLKRGENGLEIYVMIEVPSNVILAEDFADLFDGFSIGSNDLTQLSLGLDRDSDLLSDLFDENNAAIRKMVGYVIEVARSKGIKVGLCGQAASDSQEFTHFLVEKGIDSISFNPDALISGIQNTLESEAKLKNFDGVKDPFFSP